jgi:hypothetical protein
MSRTTRISADGRTIKTTSSCGCLTFFAFVVVIFGPAAWFPLPLAILAYVGLGILIVALLWAKAAQEKGQAIPPPPPMPPAA